MTTEPLMLHRDPTAVSATLEVPGRATGRPIGGSLRVSSTSIGVRLPELSAALLVLEDQRTGGLETLDRRLTQLIASGSLKDIAGVALGSLEGFCDQRALIGLRNYAFLSVWFDGTFRRSELVGIDHEHQMPKPTGKRFPCDATIGFSSGTA